MDEGSDKGLEAGERVVPESVVKQLEARIRDLERALGKKTMQVEILEEAVKIAREKKLISGASSMAQLEQSVRCVDVELSQPEREEIAGLFA